MLDFVDPCTGVDETLDQMSFSVKPFVIGSRLKSALVRWNDRFCATVYNLINEVLRGIASVSDEAVKSETINQFTGLGDVMPLSASQSKTQWISERIRAYMDFGAEPASTASQCLDFLATVFLAAPAAHGCARTTVLSNIKFSMSGSSAKCRCMRSQMPWSHQRANRLYTLFHLPYTSGNKRHCAPLRKTQSTPSMKHRHSASFPTYTDGHVRRNLSTFDQALSDSFTVMGSYSALILSNVNTT